jgi:pimeloyl-ACP methyl ester carboxylesterase
MSPLAVGVREMGSGSPIVFLHGLVGLNEHWDAVCERVASKSRCIMLEVPLLDLRGSECSVDGVTRMTAAFLRDQIKEPAILVGNSFGGHVALRIAHEHPDLVRGLVLAGSSGLFERTVWREFQIRPTRAWLAKKIGELFFDPANIWESDIDRAFGELSQREGARAMVRLSKSAKNDHLGERLKQIDKPALLLWGKQDIVTPPETAQEFHQLLRRSKLIWIDQCGHAPMMEHPDAFAHHMLAFLEDFEAPRS